MKILVSTLLILFATGLAARAAERILRYDTRIEVETNGDLIVTETIRVRAEGREIKRGIYRDIPRLHQSKWGLKKKKPFTVLSVHRNGEPEPYQTEDIGQGGLRIRIGQRERFLRPGEHTYEIVYRTGRQLYLEEEEDVLYWNATGTEWAFPIDAASATVVLGEEFEVTKAWAYTGAHGEEGTDYSVEVNGNEVMFHSTRGLKAKEGLTVVVRWSAGLLDAVAYENRDSLVRDHPGVVLAILLFIGAILYNLLAWFQVGVDPKKGVIIPRYDPPADFSPAAVRYLERMGFDNTCFSAGVLGLAVKGFLTIEEKGETYVLEKQSPEEPPALLRDERRLYAELLGKGEKVELRQSNHKRIGGARKALKKALSAKLEKTHFVNNLGWWLPGVVLSLLCVLVLVLAGGATDQALFMMFWLSIWTVGTSVLVSRTVSLWRSGSAAEALGLSLFSLLFVLGWVVGCVFFFSAAGPWAAVALLILGPVNFTFYHLIKAPTHLGRKVLDHIEGFKHYLSVAEADRLNLEHPPEQTPELFERFLPYALALDCQQEWTEKFDAILQAAATGPVREGPYRPTFYTGSRPWMAPTVGAAALAGSLTGALASSASAPSSSGSGGSGGGGFSGGGGGGGGGGGW